MYVYMSESVCECSACGGWRRRQILWSHLIWLLGTNSGPLEESNAFNLCSIDVPSLQHSFSPLPHTPHLISQHVVALRIHVLSVS